MRASCLCGAIRFTLDLELRAPRYCYCEHCTKFAGTSPATWAIALKAKLDVSASSGRVARYDSGKGLRCFCTTCGSPVWFESKDHPEYVAIPLGVLDDGDVPPPEMHIWVGSKPAWCAIHDDLPRFDADPV
jgi:hypothetical protein